MDGHILEGVLKYKRKRRSRHFQLMPSGKAFVLNKLDYEESLHGLKTCLVFCRGSRSDSRHV